MGEDRAEHRGDHLGLTLGHMRQDVADEVDPAALVAGALHGPADGGDEAGVLVGDDQAHPGQATVFEVGEELAPERLVLPATGSRTSSRWPSAFSCPDRPCDTRSLRCRAPAVVATEGARDLGRPGQRPDVVGMQTSPQYEGHVPQAKARGGPRICRR